MRFTGFNEKFVKTFKDPVAGFKSIEVRAGQYILTNPNVAIVTDANLGPTGAKIGSTGRAAYMFHQGIALNQGLGERMTHQFGGDIQVYRNPNQIQFASTAAGAPLLIQGVIGLALSGPLVGTGNATRTPNGAVLSADQFQVLRLNYRIDHAGFKTREHDYPIAFNLQLSRNVGTGQPERDALLASFKLGSVRKPWDKSFLYIFAIKGANSMISQLTDDNLGTGTGVNIRTHHFRMDLGLLKGVQFQNLLYLQNQLRNSGQYPDFFVPVPAYAPRQYRFQSQLVFTF
jgi:hypothetical protein